MINKKFVVCTTVKNNANSLSKTFKLISDIFENTKDCFVIFVYTESNDNTKKLIINPENPNGLSVDMTAEEETQHQADIETTNTVNAEYQTEKQNKENNQASGNQKLLDLGLTQAEATALTGYTPPASE